MEDLPRFSYCPVWNENLNRETSEKHAKDLIEDLKMFTPNRKFNCINPFVQFGASEIIMTAIKKNIIDSAVMVCDGAGTVIIKNSELVQGIGAKMSGLIKTEPINEIIEHIENEGGIVLNQMNAEIDQVKGVKKAIEEGCKKIAVTVVKSADAKELKEIEEKNKIELILIGVHLTGLENKEIDQLFETLDLITACAHDYIRKEIKPKLQAGDSVPMFAITDKGVDLLFERAKDVAKNVEGHIFMKVTNEIILNQNKQPGPKIQSNE